jgi:hypothetical protein
MRVEAGMRVKRDVRHTLRIGRNVRNMNRTTHFYGSATEISRCDGYFADPKMDTVAGL